MGIERVADNCDNSRISGQERMPGFQEDGAAEEGAMPSNDMDVELVDTALSRHNEGFEPLSVGYTPFDDVEQFGDGMFATMIVPDTMHEESDSGEERSLICISGDIKAVEDDVCGVNNIEENTDERVVLAGGLGSFNPVVDESHQSPYGNFEDLASLALRQLEDEYRLTTQRLENESPCPSKGMSDTNITAEDKKESRTSNDKAREVYESKYTFDSSIESEIEGNNAGIVTEIVQSDDLSKGSVQEIRQSQNDLEQTDVCSPKEINRLQNRNDKKSRQDEPCNDDEKKNDKDVIHDRKMDPKSNKERADLAADTDRIRKAMQSMRIASPRLTEVLDSGWETRIKKQLCGNNVTNKALKVNAPIGKHDIIPPAPLAAFDENNYSSKAVKASGKLSRSASLAEALTRLANSTPSHILLGDKKVLTIDVIGVDRVECESIEVLQGFFSPFVRWLDAAISRRQIFPSKQIDCIQLNLIGPCLPESYKSWPPIDLMPKNSLSTSTEDGERRRGLRKACARCFPESYHHYAALSDENCAEMAVAFNAGIWGYDEWLPTLEFMSTQRRGKGLPFVVTAYTLEECDDDADTIRKQLLQLSDNSGKPSHKSEDALKQKPSPHCIWPPEHNPYRSRVERETATAAKGRKYYENGAWQAWLF